MIVVHTDDRVGAVAIGVAGQDAGQPLEVLGGGHGIAQSLAGNVEGPVTSRCTATFSMAAMTMLKAS